MSIYLGNLPNSFLRTRQVCKIPSEGTTPYRRSYEPFSVLPLAETDFGYTGRRPISPSVILIRVEVERLGGVSNNASKFGFVALTGP